VNELNSTHDDITGLSQVMQWPSHQPCSVGHSYRRTANSIQ